MYRNKPMLVCEGNKPMLVHEGLIFKDPIFFSWSKQTVSIFLALNCQEFISGMSGRVVESIYCYQLGAGAECDHQIIGVRTRVRAGLDLDVRGACVRRKKPSQLTPWYFQEGLVSNGV